MYKYAYTYTYVTGFAKTCIVHTYIHFLNQARCGRREPGFLKSLSLRECTRVCVCVRARVCVCEYAPEAIIVSGVIYTLYDWLNNGGCFSLPFYSSCSSMSSIGVALVMKCVASYNQRRLS